MGGGGGSRKICFEEEHTYGSKDTPRLTRRVRVPAPTSQKNFAKQEARTSQKKFEQNGTCCTNISYSSSSRSEKNNKISPLGPGHGHLELYLCKIRMASSQGEAACSISFFMTEVFACHRKLCNCSATNGHVFSSTPTPTALALVTIPSVLVARNHVDGQSKQTSHTRSRTVEHPCLLCVLCRHFRATSSN